MDSVYHVTYIKHSGVLVETDSAYLLFDYWEGQIPPLKSGKDLYVFSSHIHRDHFTKHIFKLENSCVNVHYILSSDIRDGNRDWKRAEDVTFVDPCCDIKVASLRVRCFESTDEGVAFLVDVDGLKIYHAGDLHWWYWPAEPAEVNEGRRRQNYLKQLAMIGETLDGGTIDLAFVVLDPRQGEAGSYGMEEFLTHVPARRVFPIHFWENYDYVREYIEKFTRKYPAVHIVKIEKQGQIW